MKRFDDAENAFRKALSLEPGNAEFLANLALVAMNRGDLAGAESTLREALRLDPDNARNHMNLGIVYLKQKKAREAASVIGRAAALEPASVEAHQLLGEALELSGDLAGAVRAYRRALEIDSSFTRARVALDRCQKSLKR